MKDYIYVYDNDGNKEKMEVVLTFENYKTSINYIIYKSLKNVNEFFVARYNPNSRLGAIETNLNEEEKKFVSKVFNNFKEGVK